TSTQEGTNRCPLWAKADVCSALADVCFTPNSDRESEIPQKAMSALPSKADMCSALGDVYFGPIVDMVLFDQFVGAAEHRLRHDDAKRLRGREVDNQFIFGRRLNRHVGRLLALQNAIDIAGCTSVLVNRTRTIRHKAAIGGVVTIGIDRRQSKPRRKWNDYVAVEARSSRRHDQAALCGACKRRNGTLDLSDIEGVNRRQLHSE